MAPETPEPKGLTTCSACGAAFTCGAQAAEPRCWCFELPPLAAISGTACLCRSCLEHKLEAQGTYRT